MAILIDTSTVGPRERFDYWMESWCELLHPLKLRRHGDAPFNGRASVYRLGQLGVFRISSDPCSVARTSCEIAVSDHESLLVAIQVRGPGSVEQGKRTTTIRPGEVAICDSSQPYTVHAPACFETVTYVIPRDLLGLAGDRLRRQTAQAIPVRSGLGRLAVGFLLDVANGLDAGTVPEGEPHVGESALGLLRGLCADRRDDVAASRGRMSELALRVQASIEERLRDPDLSPESIARENAISIRYLYKLFEQTDASVSEWIRARRLDRCRRDLADPALREESIHTVASRWGIPSATHFSRLFRQAYGCSPREFRARALADGDDGRPLPGAAQAG